MLFWIFGGLVLLYVLLSHSFLEFKTKKLQRVVEITEVCSLLIGIVGLIITSIIMFIVLVAPYPPDLVYDVRTKVTSAELNSVKYSDGYYHCIQATANGEYIQADYSALDISITIKKDISPRIETIVYTGKAGPLWITPFVIEKQSTKYRLYVPLNRPSSFDIN